MHLVLGMILFFFYWKMRPNNNNITLFYFIFNLYFFAFYCFSLNRSWWNSQTVLHI